MEVPAFIIEEAEARELEFVECSRLQGLTYMREAQLDYIFVINFVCWIRVDYSFGFLTITPKCIWMMHTLDNSIFLQFLFLLLFLLFFFIRIFLFLNLNRFNPNDPNPHHNLRYLRSQYLFLNILLILLMKHIFQYFIYRIALCHFILFQMASCYILELSCFKKEWYCCK